MNSTLHAICLLITLIFSFGVLLVWGIRPMLSSRESDAYRQFVLTDMYVLVLQIALVGLILRGRISNDDVGRFLGLLLFFALVLALLWRFIVAALDDNGIQGGKQRVCVLFVAPIQILAGPVAPLIGVAQFGARYSQPTESQIWAWGLIAAGVLIPLGARLVYNWALRSTPKVRTDTGS